MLTRNLFHTQQIVLFQTEINREIKKIDLIRRLELLNAKLGSWDKVADAMGSSRAQVYKYKKGDYDEVKPSVVEKIKRAERFAGITPIGIESLLHNMLTERYALLYNLAGKDAFKFEELTGIPFNLARCYEGDPLPAPNEIRRIALIAREDSGKMIDQADEAIRLIETQIDGLKNRLDAFRNLVFHARQRDQLGLLENDPLLMVLDAYENELKS